MIHDPSVEVTCDGSRCRSSLVIDHAAELRDSEIEREVAREEWIVRGGRHYCSAECADEPKRRGRCR